MRNIASWFSLCSLTLIGCGTMPELEATANNTQSDALTDSTPARMEERTLLSPELKVYVHNGVVINHPYPGFEARTLPTQNMYRKTPGCYLACYSHDSSNAVYPQGNYFVVGQYRVNGRYAGRICQPKGFADAPVDSAAEFTQYCTKKFPTACANDSCWAGGDTGGWFGAQ